MSISIIIPTYNESENVENIFIGISPFVGCEVIFVDGGSTDNTVELIEKRGGRVFVSPKKGRAAQMNYGAEQASGDILWFLHADSRPQANSIEEIFKLLKNFEVGCFTLRFDSKHPFMYVGAFFSNFRVKNKNVAFGDQGIFIKRRIFEQVGGYANLPIMEDYQLSLDISKLGYKIGISRAKITTSARRFETNGIIKTILHMKKLQKRFLRGEFVSEKDYY